MYTHKCDWVECDEEYIGKSARTSGERHKEHLRAPSPIYDHVNTTGHHTSMHNLSFLGVQNCTTLPKLSRRPYLKGLMIHLLIGTSESINCHTYGMRSYSTPQTSRHSLSHLCFTVPLANLGGMTLTESSLNLAWHKSSSILQFMVGAATLKWAGDRKHTQCYVINSK